MSEPTKLYKNVSNNTFRSVNANADGTRECGPGQEIELTEEQVGCFAPHIGVSLVLAETAKDVEPVKSTHLGSKTHPGIKPPPADDK